MHCEKNSDSFSVEMHCVMREHVCAFVCECFHLKTHLFSFYEHLSLHYNTYPSFISFLKVISFPAWLRIINFSPDRLIYLFSNFFFVSLHCVPSNSWLAWSSGKNRYAADVRRKCHEARRPTSPSWLILCRGFRFREVVVSKSYILLFPLKKKDFERDCETVLPEKDEKHSWPFFFGFRSCNFNIWCHLLLTLLTKNVQIVQIFKSNILDGVEISPMRLSTAPTGFNTNILFLIFFMDFFAL